jgi:hypothetical protein
MSRAILVATSCLILAGLAAAAGLTPAQYYEIRLRADERFEKREYAEALPLYEELRATNPGDGDVLYRLAISRYASGDPEGAIPTMSAALDQGFGQEPLVSYEISRILARAGRGEESLEWLERALAARFEERAGIKEDDAFESLHADEHFRTLAGMLPDGELTREQGWSYDLGLFLEEARRLHVAPSGVAQTAEFASAVAALEARVGELTDQEIALELQKIIVTLGDGHCVLYPIPTERVSFPPLPLKFYFFSDGLYVIDADEAHTGLVGRKVMAIGDKSVDNLVEELQPYVSRDNNQGIFWLGPAYLRLFTVLRDMGYTDSEASAVLTLETPDGTQSVETLTAAPSHFDLGLNPAALAEPAEQPLWMRNISDNFWHVELPELDAVYFQFNQVQDKEDQSIEVYAGEFREFLDASGAPHLIVDVRHNNGGNNTLMGPLVRLLVYFEQAAPENRIIVITGRNTFSACQNFINSVERETDAMFVGEPSSSKPNFVGEDTGVELPYSGLRLSISSRYWQDSFPGDRRQWIPVAMPVSFSSRDYYSGRDPVLEALTEVFLARAGDEKTDP